MMTRLARRSRGGEYGLFRDGREERAPTGFRAKPPDGRLKLDGRWISGPGANVAVNVA